MKFSVCVASVRPTTLPMTIQSIRAQTLPDWELIIVGQGPDPQLPALGAAAASEDRRIRYLHLEQRGLSRARNAALRVARGDVIAMTDDDCEARRDWLESLARYFECDPLTGVVGGSVIAPPTHGFPSVCLNWTPSDTVYDPLVDGPRAPAGWCWFGANFALRPAIFERMGDFDEYLGAGAEFPSAEDVDYRLRLERSGIRMRSTPHAVVYHTYGRRSGWKALWGYWRNTFTGDGALGAKLTMLGDPRGRHWPWQSTRDWLATRLQSGRSYRLAFDLLCRRYVRHAYRECLADYELDPQRRVLRRRLATG